jgi:hypothetical protein
MIEPKQIPDEALEAAAIELHRSMWGDDCFSWAEIDSDTRDSFRHHAHAACLAMLNAWEGGKWHTVQVPDDSDEVRYMLKKVGIILPLPKEGADE